MVLVNKRVKRRKKRHSLKPGMKVPILRPTHGTKTKYRIKLSPTKTKIIKVPEIVWYKDIRTKVPKKESVRELGYIPYEDLDIDYMTPQQKKPYLDTRKFRTGLRDMVFAESFTPTLRYPYPRAIMVKPVKYHRQEPKKVYERYGHTGGPLHHYELYPEYKLKVTPYMEKLSMRKTRKRYPK